MTITTLKRPLHFQRRDFVTKVCSYNKSFHSYTHDSLGQIAHSAAVLDSCSNFSPERQLQPSTLSQKGCTYTLHIVNSCFKPWHALQNTLLQQLQSYSDADAVERVTRHKQHGKFGDASHGQWNASRYCQLHHLLELLQC